MDDARETTGQPDAPTLAWRTGGALRAASLWFEQAEDEAPAPEPAPLDGDTTADVVVVGAGLAGLWTAYYLLEADPALDVLLVEGDVVGAGATGRSGGWCSAGSPAVADAVAAVHGPQAAQALRAALRDAVVEVGGVAAAEQIDCDFAVGGLLTLARTPEELGLLAEAAHRSAAWGDEVDVLTAAEVAARTGAPALGGTFSPDCARLHPVHLARGLADVVRSRGGRLAEGTRALRVAPRALVTDQGVVRAGTVVLATGEVPGSVGTRGVALRGPVRGGRRVGRVVGPRLRSVATAPLPAAALEAVGLERGCTLTHAGPDALRVVRTADDRLVATGWSRATAWSGVRGWLHGGGSGRPGRWPGRLDGTGRTGADRRHDPLGGGPCVDVHLDADQDPAGTRRLRDALVDLLPAARGVPVTHAWSGPVASPGVGREVGLGHDEASGVAWTGGLGTDGVAAANLVGRVLADLLTGADSALSRLPALR